MFSTLALLRPAAHKHALMFGVLLSVDGLLSAPALLRVGDTVTALP
jgi:hypothetical protein